MIARIEPRRHDQPASMIPRTTLRHALTDPNLLGSVLSGASWRAWRVLLIAAMGEELDGSERSLFSRLTGRAREPRQRVEEFTGVIGRRGGKSRAISTLATYLSGLCEHPALVSGEVGVILIIAPDQRQAGIVLDYVEANFRGSPVLRHLIVNRTSDALELNNRITVEVRAANFRRLRGPTYIAVIADESAFWISDEWSSNPDIEILNAVRPGLATTGGPLFMISSPYARRGELWRNFNRHFGPAGDPLVLVAQGTSRIFNPTLPQRVVDRAMDRDAASASAEYLAEFRSDIESFISIEAVQACVCAGVRERPPEPGTRYFGFTDPSGGAADSFTLAIAHRHGDGALLDALREVKPPFSPEAVVVEFAALLKSYGLARVQGDRYAGEWPREVFRNHGIQYDRAEKPKSDLYVTLLPVINSRRVDLLDHPRLVQQLVDLERRTARSGKDSIDHAPGGHDDVANAAAGVIASIVIRTGTYNTNLSDWVGELSPAERSRWINPLVQRLAAAHRWGGF